MDSTNWTFSSLQAALEELGAYSGPIQMSLPLGSVGAAEDVFQHRVYDPYDNSSSRHVEGLVRALRDAGDLEPISVLPLAHTGRFIVIDGHHRIAAYRKARKTEIPAEVFQGTLADALVLSAKGNTRDKLPMTKAGKMQAAWSMVCNVPSLSKAATVKAAGVSDGTVATMRATRQRLLAEQVDPTSMKWEEARTYGRDKGEWSEDETEAMAQDWCNRLQQAFGPSASANPEIFLKALELYSPNLLRRLSVLIVDEFGDDHFDDGDSDF